MLRFESVVQFNIVWEVIQKVGDCWDTTDIHKDYEPFLKRVRIDLIATMLIAIWGSSLLTTEAINDTVSGCHEEDERFRGVYISLFADDAIVSNCDLIHDVSCM
jgi:hypothetical protein